MTIVGAGLQTTCAVGGQVSAPVAFTDTFGGSRIIASVPLTKNTLVDLYNLVTATVLLQNPSTTDRLNAWVYLYSTFPAVDQFGPIMGGVTLLPLGEASLTLFNYVKIPKTGTNTPYAVLAIRSDGPLVNAIALPAVRTTSLIAQPAQLPV